MGKVTLLYVRKINEGWLVYVFHKQYIKNDEPLLFLASY